MKSYPGYLKTLSLAVVVIGLVAVLVVALVWAMGTAPERVVEVGGNAVHVDPESTVKVQSWQTVTTTATGTVTSTVTVVTIWTGGASDVPAR